MYEISKGNAPDCMTSKFEKSNNIHVTRNSMSVFNIPSHNMCYVMSEDHNGNKCSSWGIAKQVARFVGALGNESRARVGAFRNS